MGNQRIVSNMLKISLTTVFVFIVLRGISASEKTEKLRQNLDAIRKMHDKKQRLYHEQFKNCSKMDVFRKIVAQGTGKYKNEKNKKSQLHNTQIGLRFDHPKKEKTRAEIIKPRFSLKTRKKTDECKLEINWTSLQIENSAGSPNSEQKSGWQKYTYNKKESDEGPIKLGDQIEFQKCAINNLEMNIFGFREEKLKEKKATLLEKLFHDRNFGKLNKNVKNNLRFFILDFLAYNEFRMIRFAIPSFTKHYKGRFEMFDNLKPFGKLYFEKSSPQWKVYNFYGVHKLNYTSKLSEQIETLKNSKIWKEGISFHHLQRLIDQQPLLDERKTQEALHTAILHVVDKIYFYRGPMLRFLKCIGDHFFESHEHAIEVVIKMSEHKHAKKDFRFLISQAKEKHFFIDEIILYIAQFGSFGQLVVVGDILGSFILRNTFDENGENALFKACRHLSSYECWEKVEYLLETHHFDRTHKNNNLHTALDVVKKLKVMHDYNHLGYYHIIYLLTIV